MLVAQLTACVGMTVSAAAHRAPALIVGGGPAGLATAWVLDKAGFAVTLCERRPEASMYESQKAYLYLVDGRGQGFTDTAGLTEELASPALSVSSTNYTVTRLMPDGKRINAVPPILEPADRPAYWIPRQQLCALLARNLPTSVRTLYGTELQEVLRTAEGGIEVAFSRADGTSERVRPTLLVGADGLGSAVRAKCAEWSAADASLGATADDFTIRELPSPSSGLNYKMLRLPPDFKLAADEPGATATPRQAYSVRPAKSAPLGQTRLGLLPVADPAYPRTANVILPPKHPVWSLDGGAAVRGWLADTFPHLPVNEIVSAEEAEDFASATPGAFPAPCYSPRQQLVLPKAAVCLVGDAVHAFPPDIGQGVNAALQDVLLLSRALNEEDAPDDKAAAVAAATPPGETETDAHDAAMASLRRALPAYGRECAPEAEAVARIAQIGFPCATRTHTHRHRLLLAALRILRPIPSQSSC